MRVPIGRILVPDPVSSISLSSLAKIRCELRSSKAQSDSELLLKELIATTTAKVAAEAQLLPDPFAACVLILAAQGDLALYVAAPSKSCCYQIDPAAIREGRRGFSVCETIADGHFAVVRSRMFQDSIEAQLDGQSIVVRDTEAYSALKLRPTSQSKLVEVVREVIDVAKSQNVDLTRKQLLERVRKNNAIRRVTDGRIVEIARDLKPKEWSKPGPKSKLRRSR